MPYADKERQRAYNREWWKRDSGYAEGPLAREVAEAVRRLGVASPSQIVDEIGRSNTNSVSVALQRLRFYGRVRRLGYGKWTVAE